MMPHNRQDRVLRSPARRAVLRTAIGPATALASQPQQTSSPYTGDVLVFLFLRGGMDALTLVPPVGDAEYYQKRPTLAVPPIGMPQGALSLGDPLFGLHPSAAALLPIYQAGELAILHTAGSTDPTRSHFDAMRAMEAGLPEQTLPAPHLITGWLARHLSATDRGNDDPRALFMDTILPTSMAGYPRALPIPHPEGFRLGGDPGTRAARRQILGEAYGRAGRELAGAAGATLTALDRIGSIDFAGYAPSHGAQYPGSSFGRKLRNVAAIIKAGVGAEVIEADMGSWDFHADMGPNQGWMALFLQELCDSLAAFHTDLGDRMQRVTVMAISEFGRRVAENGSAGTDHGHGGAILLMGANVRGGRIDHDWQGLSDPDLDDGSLQVRIDYRDVVGELLRKRLRNGDLAPIFPNHTVVERNLFRG